MSFTETRPIYIQVADYVCEQILSEKWKIGERILSIRELGALLEVNPNTVLRSYDFLQNKDIIVNKRGLGYFTAENAIDNIMNFRKEQFFKEELPEIFKNMKLLHIKMSEIREAYKLFKTNSK